MPNNPPFTYGPTSIPANNVFTMSSANSLPALVVWLFLVTNPDFQGALQPGGDVSIVPVSEIAKATNLSEQSVNAILDCYKAAPAALKSSFEDVADAFTTFAKGAGYTRTNCPTASEYILKLSGPAAEIDPSKDLSS